MFKLHFHQFYFHYSDVQFKYLKKVIVISIFYQSIWTLMYNDLTTNNFYKRG